MELIMLLLTFATLLEKLLLILHNLVILNLLFLIFGFIVLKSCVFLNIVAYLLITMQCFTVQFVFMASAILASRLRVSFTVARLSNDKITDEANYILNMNKYFENSKY